VVPRVSAAPTASTASPLRRRPVARGGRAFVRGVLHMNAVLVSLPGMLAFVVALIGTASVIVDTANDDFSAEMADRIAATGVSSVGLLLLSILMMLFGALIYLGLYVEDHLYEIRRRQ